MEKEKNERKAKIINAFIIGFLGGVVLFGFTAWLMGAKKNFIGFLIPMLFPIIFIYRALRKPKKDS